MLSSNEGSSKKCRSTPRINLIDLMNLQESRIQGSLKILGYYSLFKESWFPFSCTVHHVQGVMLSDDNDPIFHGAIDFQTSRIARTRACATNNSTCRQKVRYRSFATAERYGRNFIHRPFRPLNHKNCRDTARVESISEKQKGGKKKKTKNKRERERKRCTSRCTQLSAPSPAFSRARSDKGLELTRHSSSSCLPPTRENRELGMTLEIEFHRHTMLTARSFVEEKGANILGNYGDKKFIYTFQQMAV